MDSVTLKALTGLDNCTIGNVKDLMSNSPSSFTATILGANKVYNVFPGRVLFLGSYRNMGTVTVKVSPYEIIRYLNLSGIRAWLNTQLNAGDMIGQVYSRSVLQFEYCTSGPDTSAFPVRVNDTTYYKQNPLQIFTGVTVPEERQTAIDGLLPSSKQVKFTQDQQMEWGYPEYNTIDSNVYQVTNIKDAPEGAIAMLTGNYNGGP